MALLICNLVSTVREMKPLLHISKNYDIDRFEVPHHLVKRVGPIVFKGIFSLVLSISIFGYLTNCVVDDLCLKGCWLVGTLPVKHNFIEVMIKQYLPVNLSE